MAKHNISLKKSTAHIKEQLPTLLHRNNCGLKLNNGLLAMADAQMAPTRQPKNKGNKKTNSFELTEEKNKIVSVTTFAAACMG